MEKLEPMMSNMGRTDFTPGFVFGAGTSAYQCEGAIDGHGRGPSIWDTFLQKTNPDLLEEYKTAADHYNRYKEDVQIMKEMNLDAYRFSISWPRLLPNGRWKSKDGKEPEINHEGVKFYNDLIDELKKNGIEPFVTLFHWDLPQALEDEYQGFLGGDKFVEDYRDYAELCFALFGNRVKYWTTFNEPNTFTMGAYYTGNYAPGRGFSGGDYKTEPYEVMHNLLLAHGEAVKLYREKFQISQKGKIGIAPNAQWPMPYSDSEEDINAANRAIEFQLGWCLRPLIFGDYPEVMKAYVGQRLPKFTNEESEKLKGSIDFLGVNYYTSTYAKNDAVGTNSSTIAPQHADSCVTLTPSGADGKDIGAKTAEDWLYVVPKGIKELLLHIKKVYQNPPMYIMENGYPVENKELSVWESLCDYKRICYHYQHLCQVKKAITKEGINVKGYFVWSLLDCLEWDEGSSVNFGMNFVSKNKDRYPKLSSAWFKYVCTR